MGFASILILMVAGLAIMAFVNETRVEAMD
jgi:hypothetical protein